MTKDELKYLASTTAISYGLDPTLFVAVIGCESHWNPNAVGDFGTSFGLAQLHYPTRDWGISTSTALDPYTSLDIAARAWTKGKQSKWSCFNAISRGS